MRSVILATVFSLLCLGVALFFLLLGKEAPRFATVGWVYLVASWLLLWLGFFLFRRRRRAILLSAGLGVLVLAAAYPVYYATEKDDARRDLEALQAVHNTEVLDLRDEPLHTPAGNPIGVRLSFSVRFPRSGPSAPTPSMFPIGPQFQGARVLRAFRMTVEPAPEPLRNSPLRPPYGRYRAGQVYRFTADMLPSFYFPSAGGGGPCIVFTSPIEKIASTAEGEVRFQFHISGTSLDPLFGSAITGQAYSLKSFYDTAVKEGAREPCRF